MVKGSRRSVRARVWERRYTPATFRVVLACAVAAAVCIVELGPSSGADTSFVPGNAQAHAQAISLAPTTGGLNYAITLATSISDYQDVESQSLSQTIDLGAIGTALEAQGCDGGNPTLPASDVPPPVQVESTSGNQSQTSSITPESSPDGLGIGNESASATTQPTSDATTTVHDIAVPGGLLTVDGLTSTTHTSVDGNATRTATATADVSRISLAGGAVVLGGLHWAATQQTGGATASTGTFSVGSLSVEGAPVDLSQVGSALTPQSVFSIINTALSPVGINIEWPSQTTLDDGTVQISPLVIGIDNNELGQQVIGANQNGVQPVREALVNALLSANCNLADAILVGDIGLGVLAGGGNLNVELGGASAMTNDHAASSPFGPGSNALPPSGGTLSAGSSGNSGSGGALTAGSAFAGNSGTGALTQAPGAAAGGPGTGQSPGGGRSASALGPTEKASDCISLGPSGGGCSLGNAAVPVGLGALALVVGLFTWDYLRQRRRMPLYRAEMSS